ncbi:hypothetical protein OOJ91_00255 [Micromonospora lupini]|uniref:hypothetical protein n=1 Tax=Micromonospora lupini TaxID=285679 RepID=UPI00224FF85B|nr:hypothetical protein [Micromonospora lupini]MCX5064294.1 hypothetical protein [Micromonospora lupini]
MKVRKTQISGASRAMLVLMIAVVMASALATPAQAGTDDTACTYYGCYNYQGWGSGYGEWNHSGDVMWVCDAYPDGWSVVVIAWLNGVRAPNKWDTSGAGDGCTERSYGDLPEGTEVKFQACLGDYSETIIRSCGYTRWAYA